MRDDANLRETILRELPALLRRSTSVPEGEHEILPGDERIRAAVEDAFLPRFAALGPDEIRRHEAGDVALRFGPEGDDGLLIQCYVVSQHGDLAEDPEEGEVLDGAPYGYPGPILRGRGASQNKGPMAAVLAALATRPERLASPVWVSLNCEGMSSHGGSRRILDELGVRAAAGVLAIGTDLRVSLGNRGRVDVYVGIPGTSSHSSRPVAGENPIARAAEVVAALPAIPLPAPHPRLGAAQAEPYQLTFSPLAPHTIPARGRLIVDRRLLPGESPAGAVAEAAEALRARLGFAAEIEEGPSMLPAEVAPDAPHVVALLAALEERGLPAEAVFSRNTFDAGYGCSVGIPSVMFGPGRRDFSAGITAAELVAVEDCVAAAAVLGRLLDDLAEG